MLRLAGFARTFIRAEGSHLVDLEGRRYFDAVGGYGALNLGHCHPEIVATLRAILDRGVPSFTQVDASLLTALAAQRILAASPPGYAKVLFVNSGSEAVDLAVRLGRAATGRKLIVSLEGGYHGSTLGTMGLGGVAKARQRYRPFVAGMTALPRDDRTSLADLLVHKTCAAVVFEAIQGEGGVHELEASYLRFVQDLCRETGTLLIADEVQTGLGRTGDFFGFEASGIRPDVVAIAKSLSGGLVPVGAIVAAEKPFRCAFGSLRHAFDAESTFGGGALAMAAAYSTVQILTNEALAVRAAEQGGLLLARLRQALKAHPLVRAVRGRGLMIGIDFAAPPWPIPHMAQEGARSLLAQYVSVELIREHGIVAQVAGLDPGVLKLTPPLVAPAEELERLPNALSLVLSSLSHPKALLALAGRMVEAAT